MFFFLTQINKKIRTDFEHQPKKLFLLLFLPALAHAQTAELNDSNIQTEREISLQKQLISEKENRVLVEQNNEMPQTQAAQQTVLNDEDLLRQPELLKNWLQQALNSQDADLIESLANTYQKVNDADENLLRHARATVARLRGDYATAVREFKNLHQSKPQDERIALDTAQTLFEDKQWKTADGIFAQVAAQNDVPQAVRDNIQPYRQAIAKQQSWQFGGSVNVSRDANVNQVPEPYCTPIACVSPKKEVATGVNYSLWAEKNTNLTGNHNLLFRSHFAGTTYYWSKKSEYDQAFGRAFLGWQYQSAKTQVNVLPFYQWQLAGSDAWENKEPRSHTFNSDLLASAWGVQTAWTQTLSPSWQSHFSAEWYQQRYRPQEKDAYYSGQQYSASANLRHALNRNHMISAGWSVGLFRPKQKTINAHSNHNAFHRNSVHAAWFAQWQALGGLQSQISASYTDRRYRGAVLNHDFQSQRRHNRETALSASFAHPKIQAFGLTPKLVWERQSIKSSHKWAERQQNSVYLAIDTAF